MAGWQTHAIESITEPDGFSPQDKEITKNMQMDAYLGTYDNRIMIHEYKTGKIRTIGKIK